MSELDLCSVYDTYAATTVANLDGIALHAGAVVTARGLTLLPSQAADEVAGLALDRLVVTGVEARVLAAPLLDRLAAVSPQLRRTYLHADASASMSATAPRAAAAAMTVLRAPRGVTALRARIRIGKPLEAANHNPRCAV